MNKSSNNQDSSQHHYERKYRNLQQNNLTHILFHLKLK